MKLWKHLSEWDNIKKNWIGLKGKVEDYENLKRKIIKEINDVKKEFKELIDKRGGWRENLWFAY